MGNIQNTKKIHLEIIRFLAVCLVVFNHTDGYFLYFSNTDNPVTYIVSLFFSVLCRINVPLFFMVSGALLLGKQESIKELFRKRVMRIFIVLLLFSAIQYMVPAAGEDAAGKGIVHFFSSVYTGDVLESYWFLYVYLAMLICLPFYRKMAGSMDVKEFRYLFFLKILVDAVFGLIAIYTGYAVNIGMPLTADSIFYPFAGYYMEWMVREDVYGKTDIKRKMFFAGMGLLLASMILVRLEYKVKGEYSPACLGIFCPVLTIIAYYMVKSFCSSHVFSVRMQKTVLYLGNSVFGIYLIERLVRKQLLPVYLYLCDRTVGLVACFVYVAGTIVVSLIYVSIGKRIPGLKKLI